MTALERWYRVLLVSYPKSFREQRADELLAVLTAWTPEGRRSPHLADAVNLVGNGLRMRGRHREAMADAPLPTPSSAPLPETYGQALRTVWWTGFRPTIEDWSWRGVPRWARLVIGAVVVVGALCTSVVGYRHFFDYAPFVRDTGSPSQFATVAVDKTIWVTLNVSIKGNGDSSRLDVRTVTPHVLSDSAHATIEVERCTGPYLNDAQSSLNAPWLCDSLSPFASGTLNTETMTQPTHFVLAITPHSVGTTVIDGITIRAHKGIRRGSEHVGTTWTLTSHR